MCVFVVFIFLLFVFFLSMVNLNLTPLKIIYYRVNNVQILKGKAKFGV